MINLLIHIRKVITYILLSGSIILITNALFYKLSFVKHLADQFTIPYFLILLTFSLLVVRLFKVS